MNDDTLIAVPLWVLKQKVENDFIEYSFLVGAGQVELEEDTPEEFPILDSTFVVLNILKDKNINFDTSKGIWV